MSSQYESDDHAPCNIVPLTRVPDRPGVWIGEFRVPDVTGLDGGGRTDDSGGDEGRDDGGEELHDYRIVKGVKG